MRHSLDQRVLQQVDDIESQPLWPLLRSQASIVFPSFHFPRCFLRFCAPLQQLEFTWLIRLGLIAVEDRFVKNRSNNPNPTTVRRYGFRNPYDRLYSSRSNRSVECGASNPHRGRDPPHGSTAVRDHRLHASEAALWGQAHAASSLVCLR